MTNRLYIENPTATALIGLFGLLVAGSALGWSGTLPGGGELHVDPNTHRATEVQGNQSRPMWDGVHRLEDGSVVIIRGGNAVPTESMLRAWEGRAKPDEIAEGKPCERLERRVCGKDNACGSSAACMSARSLSNSEREAQRRAPMGAGPQASAEQTKACESALTDPKFPPCIDAQAATTTGPSPCQELATRVCGEDNRCASSPACPPARQLLGQESKERAEAGSADAFTPSGAQCQEAMGSSFFAPCPAKEAAGAARPPEGTK